MQETRIRVKRAGKVKRVVTTSSHSQFIGMSIDIKLLIKQVEARPALWDRDNGNYFQKTAVSKLWTEIANVQGVHESKVKSKWKSLRDTFRLELKKAIQPTTWNFYNDMSFLIGHMKVKQVKEEVEGNEEKGITTFIKSEPEESNVDFVDEFRGEVEDDTMGTNEMARTLPQSSFEPDEDYHFFMSFLPEMRKLDPRKKMLLKIKMMELFYKEVYEENVT